MDFYPKLPHSWTDYEWVSIPVASRIDCSCFEISEETSGLISVFLKHTAELPLSDSPQIQTLPACIQYKYTTQRSSHAKPCSCSEYLQELNKKGNEYLKGSSWALIEWVSNKYLMPIFALILMRLLKSFSSVIFSWLSFLLSSPHLLGSFSPVQVWKCTSQKWNFP